MIYIYGLVCPRLGEIRYVGKCKNLASRLRAHLSKARLGQTKGHCANWLRSLLANCLLPTIVILVELQDCDDWQAAEISAIRAYREAGSPLTNSTSGGDGLHDLSPDAVARRGAARKRYLQDPENLAKHIQMCRETWANPETVAKSVASLRSFWSNPDNRARMEAAFRTPQAIANRSAATKRRFQDEEQLSRHRNTMRKLFATDEHARAQIVAAGAKCRSDMEAEARRKAAIRVAAQDPGYRAKQGADSAERWACPAFKHRATEAIKSAAASRKARGGYSVSPETKAKMSAAAKARWADPEKTVGLLSVRKSADHKALLSKRAKERATPEYREACRVRTTEAWRARKHNSG